MTEEIWKPVKGYEGDYEVSNLGRVKSLKYRGHRGLESLLKPLKNRDKYPYFRYSLTKNNKEKQIYAHKLVAEAFLDNPYGYTEINHKDEDTSNNCVDNLEYCSRDYNMNYGTGRERQKQKLRKPICQFSLDGNLIKEWDGLRVAADSLGICYQSIQSHMRGKTKQAGGFIWKYKTEPCIPN